MNSAQPAANGSHFGERADLLGTLLDQFSLPRLRSCEKESNARVQREVPEEVPEDEVPEVCAATLDATVPWRRYKKIGPGAASQDLQREIPEEVPDDEVPE